MAKKHTAVEWLLQRFEDGDMYNMEDAQFIKHQAKEMEKEQIENAHLAGQECKTDFPMGEFSEQYYTQTYGK